LIVFNVDAGLVAARENGFFANEGLEVEITPTPNSTEQMRGLGTGRWEVASTAFDNVLAWSGREGAEIVAVTQVGRGVLLPVYVRPEIREWNDLRGKRLAVDAVDTAFALVLRRVLLAHGLDLKKGDYELVPEGATGARLDSMNRGDTFAGILAPPWDKKAEASGHKRFADHREVLPNYPGGVYAVSQSWAQPHRDELVKFLRSWLAGARWAQEPANREQAVQMIAAEEKLSPEGAAGRLAQSSKDGAMDLGGLQSVLDLRTQFGFTLHKGAELKSYYDVDYYQAARS
jgi:ABC-type nitrate/sulfonate/bicarbonate transport system substrate-binding protein